MPVTSDQTISKKFNHPKRLRYQAVIMNMCISHKSIYKCVVGCPLVSIVSHASLCWETQLLLQIGKQSH